MPGLAEGVEGEQHGGGDDPSDPLRAWHTWQAVAILFYMRGPDGL
jgi:hypothetical protein